MARTYPSQQLRQVLLRIPEQMRQRLEASADENGRSLTAEVLSRLESTFSEDESWLSATQRSPAVRLEKQMIGMEARLEGQIEKLERRLAKLEGKK